LGGFFGDFFAAFFGASFSSLFILGDFFLLLSFFDEGESESGDFDAVLFFAGLT